MVEASPTQLLEQAATGDAEAAERLFPLVYGELRRLAERFMERQPSDHTLQATALVHEAYVRLIDRDQTARFANKLHFYRTAAKAMRGILVNHAKAKGSQKRGGERLRLEVSDPASPDAGVLDLLSMDEALELLGDKDEQLARIVELRFFAGLTIAETADLLGVSTPTVERGWRVARSFLRLHMRSGE